MKITISLKSFHTSSRTRGIGVYTRFLTAALERAYPEDTVVANGKPVFSATDIVHIPFFDPFFLTLPIRFVHPTVLTIHDLIPLRFPEHFPAGIRGRLKWRLQRARARHAAAIVTDSVSSKADIVQYLHVPEDQVTVVPLGPNEVERVPGQQAQKIAKKYQLPDRYLLYVGDVNWNKNVPGLVDMFAAQKDPKLHLVLVGKVFSDKPAIPEYRAVATAIARSGKTDKIHEIGFVPSHHLSVFYMRATLYVQPSWYEGYGLPILEAMRFGCPVATSDRGSLPEVGGDAVAYFDPAKNMDEIVGDLLGSVAKRSALAARGTERAKTFTWERTARETHAVYEKILDASRR